MTSFTLLLLSLRAATQGYLLNKVVLRSSHQDAVFNIAVLHLWRNSLKNTCDRVRFLVNLHVTLSNFEPLRPKFKYFITVLINEQLLLQSFSRKLLLDSEKLEKISISNNQQIPCWQATTLLRTSLQTFPWGFFKTCICYLHCHFQILN